MSQRRGKSDAGAVPEKLPNQASGEIPAAAAAVVEEVEGRPAAKGNAVAARMSRTTIQVYYEQDFLGFSDGFRPGKSAHNALDAVAVDVWTK